MEKEFVPYAEAFELRDVGFDEPCICGYSKSTEQLETYSRFLVTKDSFTVDAPTFSQAFRWFRQNGYRFNIVNDSENINGYYYYDVWYNGQFMFESHYIYSTYEEAELACLRELISTVKQRP